jgi:hypothetical protein
VAVGVNSTGQRNSPIAKNWSSAYRSTSIWYLPGDYEQAQQQLIHKVGEELNNYNPKRIPVRTWVNTLRNHALRAVLDDVQLKKLALEAQRHPPQATYDNML